MARPRNHLKWGWAALFFAIVGGIALESLHAFKAEMLLGVDQETTRLMWRLAHAHGALLGVVNILYALTNHHKPLELKQGKAVSTALIMATILLPGGFLLGGDHAHGRRSRNWDHSHSPRRRVAPFCRGSDFVSGPLTLRSSVVLDKEQQPRRGASSRRLPSANGGER